MTNRDMVKSTPATDTAKVSAQVPNEAPLPPMPADEDGRRPTTDEEPVDSPQPNRDITRKPPPEGEIGLTTKR